MEGGKKGGVVVDGDDGMSLHSPYKQLEGEEDFWVQGTEPTVMLSAHSDYDDDNHNENDDDDNDDYDDDNHNEDDDDDNDDYDDDDYDDEGKTEGASLSELEGTKDDSFRNSFYRSGTDWSCLYDLQQQQQSTISFSKPTLNKLVQVELTAFWGHKPKPTKELTCEKVTVSTHSFWDKFKSFRQQPTSTVPSKKRKPSLHGPQVQQDRRNSETRKNCPFYKKIAGTSFTVDAFRYGPIDGCLAYFLTHFHSDHYGGLSKSWSSGPIYCTAVTARLVVHCLYVDSRWIFPLEIGKRQVIDGVEVTFLEANHCPGAAIILFRLKTGISILHTGDFRASIDMQRYPQLLECHINMLYLDTTYCNPRYRFPPQKDVLDFVIQCTQDSLKRNPQTLVIVGAYSIGKERVYLSIAEALQVNIYAERHRSRMLSLMDWPELAGKLSSDAKSTMLHVLPIGHLQPLKLKAYLQRFSNFTSVLAFRPTGWTFSQKQLHSVKPIRNGAITIYGVPYSEHSSFNELQEFVQFFRPGKIIPTVNNGSQAERDRMQSIFHQWLRKVSSG